MKNTKHDTIGRRLIVMRNEIPFGYIPGLERELPYKKIAHLYHGTFQDPGKPMCQKGYNRKNGEYSIWRNCLGKCSRTLSFTDCYHVGGVCRVCLKRALKGLEGVEPK